MRVGAIVPVHGPAPYLSRALDGLLAQDAPLAEIVVVDDGSPRAVVLHSAHASRCRLVRRAQSGGPAAARQTGLEALESDVVALADADDLWRAGKLRAQVGALERHPDAAMCFGRAEVIDAAGVPTGERWEEPAPGRLEAAAIAPWLFERNMIPTSSAVLRRPALEAVGGFAGPGTVRGDWDWDVWLRLLRLGRPFVYEPGAVVAYRRHAGGLTADVAALAELGLAVHEAHGSLVDEATRRRARAGDLVLLARGRIRQRRYGEARAALREARALGPLPPHERALELIVAVPGLRAGLGRRSPYRPAVGSR